MDSEEYSLVVSSGLLKEVLVMSVLLIVMTSVLIISIVRVTVANVSPINIVFQTCLLAFSQRFLRSYLSFRTYSRRVSHQGVTGPFQTVGP